MSETEKSETEKLIQERAYQLWEQAGCPPGRSDEFWFAARREIEGDVPPIGDRPGGAIDYPPESQSVEEPPAAAVQTGAPVGMPGERIAEAGVAGEHLGDMARLDDSARPAEPAAAEAPVPADESREQPIRAARAVASRSAKKAASSDNTPASGKRPGKPAPRPGRR